MEPQVPQAADDRPAIAAPSGGEGVAGGAPSADDGQAGGAPSGGERVADVAAELPVVDRVPIHRGLIWEVVREEVDLGAAGHVNREIVVHPGAVWIMVLDDRGRILLQSQYRHPVRRYLWEPPAGLRDVDGEDPLDTARRELAEEADLRAGRWDRMLDYYTSPGGSSEQVIMYLARDLSPVPLAERHVRTAEEVDMHAAWIDLDEAEAMVLDGRLHSPAAVLGILALCSARRRGRLGLAPT